MPVFISDPKGGGRIATLRDAGLSFEEAKTYMRLNGASEETIEEAVREYKRNREAR